MAPGGMSAAATYGNEGAACRRCRRHPLERSTAPPKGWDQQREESAHSPMRRRPQPAYGWATACHARAYRRSMDPSTGRPGPAQDAQTLVTSTRRPVAGQFTRWPRVADAVLALVVFL